MSGLDYQRPDSLAGAMELLAGAEDAYPLSGGTDLAVALRHGGLHPSLIVDIKRIPELARSIEQSDGMFRISANTVMTHLETHEVIRNELPGLVEAAQVVGSVQIRNRATLAGNLCNASPAADTPPVLMSLRASLQIEGPKGTRTLPVDDLIVDYRTTALEPGELVAAVLIPKPAARSGSAFLKLGVRRAMEISIVCVGASLELDERGKITAAGLGLGSVAPQTVRASAAQELLVGQHPSRDLFASAGEIAAAACSPIDDLRATGEYRRAMVPVLVGRALSTALDRALDAA